MVSQTLNRHVNTKNSTGDNGRPQSQVLLLRAHEAAALCSKSLRTLRSWDAAGLIPRPVRIGRSTLWRADELREWIAAGCPRRQEWEARYCRH
jgi:prophage regulatory protein